MTTSAGHILSLIAMARLHNLDPEQYLRHMIRVDRIEVVEMTATLCNSPLA